jgi:SPP1 family predicted phage head-tail adaptor
MLPASELAAMRTEAARILVESATWQRNTATAGSYGQPGETWATQGTVAAHIAPFSQTNQMQLEAERQREQPLFEILLPIETAIRAGDRLVIGSVTYFIQVADVNETWLVFTRAICTKV